MPTSLIHCHRGDGAFGWNGLLQVVVCVFVVWCIYDCIVITPYYEVMFEIIDEEAVDIGTGVVDGKLFLEA
jgi:uncharacterized membrane protein YdbT with pleckstrin-like domain